MPLILAHPPGSELSTIVMRARRANYKGSDQTKDSQHWVVDWKCTFLGTQKALITTHDYQADKYHKLATVIPYLMPPSPRQIYFKVTKGDSPWRMEKWKVRFFKPEKPLTILHVIHGPSKRGLIDVDPESDDAVVDAKRFKIPDSTSNENDEPVLPIKEVAES